MTPTAVLNVVGLSGSLVGEHTPRIAAFAKRGRTTRLRPDLPAVTCAAQASMITGLAPRDHGVVGNGWYHRELAEVHFWKQSNKLVRGEKVWEAARRRDPGATCLNMFWWFNMHSSADWSVTPRPMYKADGRKIPDCYSRPAGLRDQLQAKLGVFPLFQFWGPGASIASTRWIADATRILHAQLQPTLTLVYLPHLDYGLQKLGPGHADIPQHLREVDAVVGDLIDHFDRAGTRVILLSEYGIEAVDDAVHVNRALREAGLLRVREEQGLELLDAGASEAFAVADHQVAHVYVADEARVAEVAALLRALPGVEQALDRAAQREAGIDHERAGELVLVSAARRWFSYDYWLDDARAPDFARTVDIHRKPGYDPLELFLDPAIRFPKLKIAARLFQRKILKQRALLDVIPLDTRLVRGSHGRVDVPPALRPVLMTSHAFEGDGAEELSCRSVRDVILASLFGRGPDPS